MKDDTCKNCGGSEGLHHYQTMQCPVGGVGSYPSIWMDSRFEAVSNEVTRLRDALAAELEHSAALQERIETLNAENGSLHNALSLAQTRANEAERKIANAKQYASIDYLYEAKK